MSEYSRASSLFTLFKNPPRPTHTDHHHHLHHLSLEYCRKRSLMFHSIFTKQNLAHTDRCPQIERTTLPPHPPPKKRCSEELAWECLLLLFLVRRSLCQVLFMPVEQGFSLYLLGLTTGLPPPSLCPFFLRQQRHLTFYFFVPPFGFHSQHTITVAPLKNFHCMLFHHLPHPPTHFPP